MHHILDEADGSVDDLSQKKTNSQSDSTLWDSSLDQSVPEWTGNSRASRWRQTRNQDGGGAARSSEHFNVPENDSMAVEEEIRSRRRPFSNGPRRKSSAADVAAAYNDNTTDDENVYKKPLPFAQRRKKPSVPDPNAFNETHSSVEEERPVRRTRRGFSKRPKSIPNPEFFDSATMDESVVVEAKPKRFTRSARQVTEANMKAFEVSDDEEEDVGGEEREKETRGGEDEREKETRGGEDDKEGNRATETRGGGEEDREGKGTTEENKEKENSELEEGSELEEEGRVDKAGEETRNSMDESDESEAEEGGGNKSVSLVIQSEGEVGGEDSLDEDVDEEDKGEEKQVVGRAKSGVKGDQNKLQQKNLEVGGGSSNEQSSLLLEYHLSTENQSVGHNKSSASLKSSASRTMDITLASRRSRSRRLHSSV
ncbi:high mobility group nucleosome-binding domain-containing protein 5-like [Nilaparvata lugens]|uniref:high mobility group nucleosome-binding domain-containing protein 5-like n=1 Tax=Nilaparvata lugens TaxID=108931 RepID=UPI00193EB509|nr:high mobility group nucleosome-binding domain-containing protein 5-like [Nilaparvata lugens]